MDYKRDSARARLSLQSSEAEPAKRKLCSPNDTDFAPHKLRMGKPTLAEPSPVNSRFSRELKAIRSKFLGLG